jgi:hypothetical protein
MPTINNEIPCSHNTKFQLDSLKVHLNISGHFEPELADCAVI